MNSVHRFLINTRLPIWEEIKYMTYYPAHLLWEIFQPDEDVVLHRHMQIVKANS